MLDALSMLVHVAQLTGRTELFRAYEMVTTNPARAAEVPYGIAEGKPANFVVFDCADEAEAIRLRPAARLVVRNGRVVAETEPARSVVHVDGSAQPVTFRRDGTGRSGGGAGGGSASTAPQAMAGAGPSRAWHEEGAVR
jgi:cytosine/adenosine deaminase-related metal-dependent hydrolase